VLTSTSTSTPSRLPKSYRHVAGCLEHRCSSCERWKPATPAEFVAARKARFGLSSQCHACNRRTADRWRRRNPEMATAQRMRAYHRQIAATGTFTAEDAAELKARYGYRCLGCGLHEAIVGTLECDHVVPPPAGANDISNRQPLCRVCNARKGTSSIDYRPVWERQASRRTV
jgi:5-methylcytosine-specific restriction endonuclease McrA